MKVTKIVEVILMKLKRHTKEREEQAARSTALQQDKKARAQK